jgi:hypothetical protein
VESLKARATVMSARKSRSGLSSSASELGKTSYPHEVRLLGPPPNPPNNCIASIPPALGETHAPLLLAIARIVA